MSIPGSQHRRPSGRFLASSGLVALATAIAAPAAHALVTPDTTTPANVVDTLNLHPYWVGIAIRGENGASGGTCTGLLINPRTVLFAAHCVDGLDPDAYDSPTQPGNRAQVGYTTDPLFGRANLRNWLFSLDFGTQPGADGRTMTNSSFVWYDPRSRFGSAALPDNGTFLPADIAIAGFSTPTEILGRDARDGVGLLFSPVTSLVSVTMGGYGQSGNGFTGARTSGSAPESYYRRLGSNMLGFLGDERTLSLAVYGQAVGDLIDPPGLVYQDLYWADFDDPLRATRPFFAGPGADPNSTLDHDPFPGDAVAGEAITAAGDSGSPLLTTAFGRSVSLGVLSQGSRFFYDSIGNPDDNFVRSAPFSNFGTLAGYNPLFLFWDQIVVNNPYKYVGALGGVREWTDPTTWVQELDPLYYVLSGGQLANALPTAPALGVSSAAADVGTVRPNPAPPAVCAFTGSCPPSGGGSDPAGLSRLPETSGMARVETLEPGADPADDAPRGTHEVRLTDVSDARAASEGLAVEGRSDTAMAGVAQSSNLWSTGQLLQVNGAALTGPGTTGFVANNTAGVAGVQNSFRWFEVNLRNAGTLNLTGASIVIDRLNVRASGAQLNIRSGASLRTEMSSFLDAGGIHVDGALTARALNVLGGTLSGTGAVTTTGGIGVVGGIVTGGGVGSVGALTVNGDIGFAQAGVLGIDIASATSADRLDINGALILNGGGLAVNFVGGYKPVFGTSWTAANASGGVTGAFSAVSNPTLGLLFPKYAVNGNTLTIAMDALAFSSFVDANSSAQTSIGQALDSLRRSNFSSVSALLRDIDQLTPAQAKSLLEKMAPNDNFAAGQLIDASSLTLRDSLAARMMTTRAGDPAGGYSTAAALALTGSASAQTNNPEQMLNAGPQTLAAPGKGLEVFVDIRSISGKSRPAAALSASDLEATAYTVGVDLAPMKSLVIGLAGQMVQGETRLAGQQGFAETEGGQIGGYASYKTPTGVLIDAYASFGETDVDLARAFGTSSVRGETTAETLNVGVSASAVIESGALGFVPRLAVDRAYVDLAGYTETNGPAALAVPGRSTEFATASIGGTAYATIDAGGGMKVYPRVSASLVKALDDRTDVISGAAFASAPGTLFRPIAGVAQDDQWLDLGAGLDIRLDDRISFSASYQLDVDRTEIETRTLRLAGRVRF
jgi:hypothetical protein